METVGELIRRVRKEAGITQAELAGLVRTKQPAIARIESGAGAPSLRAVQRLLNVMGKSLVVGARQIEASESGVDPTLIFGNLRRTPAERLRVLKAHSESVEKLRAIGRAQRKRAAA